MIDVPALADVLFSLSMAAFTSPCDVGTPKLVAVQNP